MMIEGLAVRGTHTAHGFIPYLERNGIAMPIQIEHIGSCSFKKLPKPRIYGSTSVWAIPGGGSYTHRELFPIFT
jgi:hypothetical protein